MRRCELCVVMIAVLAGAGGRVAQASQPTPGGVTPDRLKLPSGPSSVRGLADEPSVDAFHAQVEYQVPIELPAGLGGLAPALGLAYSGALGNGPVGIGWSLGTIRIERSTRLGVPRFDATDELELSGAVSGRLVAIGGGEYRVEGQGQTIRVREVDGGFELDDGAGVRYRIGTSAASRHASADGTRVQAWLLEAQTNVAGEHIRYGYLHDAGQTYLASITWGPGDVYGAALTYEPRTDAVTSYRDGFAVTTARRLARIAITAAGTERRAYQLAYDDAFSVTRLAGVTSTGKAGAGSWPALAFHYAAAAAPVVEAIPSVGGWRLDVAGGTLVDLDGDGATELLRLADGGHSYRANHNGTFSATVQPITGNTQSIATLQLHDLDGDARAELVQETSDGWAWWRASKTQWIAQPALWPGTAGLALKQPALARYADLDGDGLVDAIRWTNDNLLVRRATRTGFLAEVMAPKIGGVVVPTAAGRFQDVTGDGLDDYLVVAPIQLELYAGRGDGTFDAMTPRAYPFTGGAPAVDSLYIADLDRDDLVDLIRVDSGTVRWFRGGADGAFATTPVVVPNPEPLTTDVVVTIADVNGNGSQDVVWSSATGMWRMDLAGPTTAGMLVRVDNGLGLETSFTYRSAHALSVEARLAGAAWQYEVPIAMPVPVETVSALGAGETTRRITYVVRDGMWDAVERRFGGFLGTIVTTWGATPAETSSVQTRYHAGTGADRVLRGMPLVEQVRNGSGVRLSFTTSTWQAVTVDGLPDVPLLRRAALRERRVRHEDSTPIRETRVATDYDLLGRAIRVVDDGRLDLSGDEVVTETTYAAANVTRWIRDLTCETTVEDAAGALVSQTQQRYGDATSIAPLCEAGAGWPRETRGWLAEQSRWVTQSATTYDALGNPITVTEDGITRTFGYDPSGLFPTSETVEPAPGQSLTWTTTWDPVLGIPVTATGPDGHTAAASYDALGRYTGTAVDGGPRRVVVEYDWTAPFPTTTTWHYDGPVAALDGSAPAWTPTGAWRQEVEVANGRGERRYRAIRRAAAEWIITDYQERDPGSRVVFAGQPTFSATHLLSARPAGMTGDTLRYDPLGRPIEQQLANGAVRQYGYTAFARTVQEPGLAEVHHQLDGQGRVTETWRSLADGTLDRVTASYDPAGRITMMTVGSGAVVRTFDYDTLGRLIQLHDPDLGARMLGWDDGGRLVSSTNAVWQTIVYGYDGAGRLVSRDDGEGGAFAYHYDLPGPGAGPDATNVASRLAWIEEPTGRVELGYDATGQTMYTRRTIDGHAMTERTSYSASGLALGRTYDDGIELVYRYDHTGGLVGIGDLWEVLEYDAAGRPLRERFGNGIEQTWDRDVVGLASEIAVHAPGGGALYDVELGRNAWSGISSVTDVDGVGLNHTSTFGYDGFGRLTSASIGATPSAYTFSYGYDALHNMKLRAASGPTALGVYNGYYHYGEDGRGPRQLTTIRKATGPVLHTFAYDDAGRQVGQDALAMTYDASDRLLAVTGLPAGTLLHAYGHDGARVRTIAPDGATTYHFNPNLTERDGIREHDIVAGDRVVARLTVPLAAGAGGGGAVAGVIETGGRIAWLALIAIALAGLAVGVLRRAARPRRRALAAGLAAAMVLPACGTAGLATHDHAVGAAATAVYAHTGIGAGPVMFSDDAGAILEERRTEPFGAAIDARVLTGSGYVVTTPDYAARDRNALNKRTDVDTGWSDHGARWLAPETGRWLSTDPPVAAPDPAFMEQPWKLHPYQYVLQNPIAFWDPDGRTEATLARDIWEATKSAYAAAQAQGAVGKYAAVAVIAIGVVTAGAAYGTEKLGDALTYVGDKVVSGARYAGGKAITAVRSAADVWTKVQSCNRELRNCTRQPKIYEMRVMVVDQGRNLPIYWSPPIVDYRPITTTRIRSELETAVATPAVQAAAMWAADLDLAVDDQIMPIINMFPPGGVGWMGPVADGVVLGRNGGDVRISVHNLRGTNLRR
jgi:RHS repeat-associated protein